MTNMMQNNITLDLNWNTPGQLTLVSTNGVFAESYTWGPLGNRLSTTDASGTTYHIYNGDHCIAAVGAGGDIIASYTWGNGIDNLQAITVYDSTATNTYYAIKDHLGSVHALIDESGTVVLVVNYNAWGTPLNSSLSIQNSSFRLRYLFQGREYSYATGLYNFRARWYDSNIGRWLSKDPIGLEGGLNLYVFCGNDPVNYRDPNGLSTVRIHTASGTTTLVDPSMSSFRSAIRAQSPSSISSFEILGHGDRHQINITKGGDGLIYYPGILNTVQMSDTGDSFADLVRERMVPGANIDLKGCNTAREGIFFDNKHITRQLSTELPNVSVTGSRGYGIANELSVPLHRQTSIRLGQENHVLRIPRTYKNGELQ